MIRESDEKLEHLCALSRLCASKIRHAADYADLSWIFLHVSIVPDMAPRYL